MLFISNSSVEGVRNRSRKVSSSCEFLYLCSLRTLYIILLKVMLLYDYYTLVFPNGWELPEKKYHVSFTYSLAPNMVPGHSSLIEYLTLHLLIKPIPLHVHNNLKWDIHTVFRKLKLKLTVKICVLALQSLHVCFILFPSSTKINLCISEVEFTFIK